MHTGILWQTVDNNACHELILESDTFINTKKSYNITTKENLLHIVVAGSFFSYRYFPCIINKKKETD